MAKKTRRRRPLTDAERAERREKERGLMADAIEQLRSSDGWKRWLDTRRHFHRYSLHNQLLIALQMSSATKVAGFRAWKELGYAVQKGERGIFIWAPCPPSKKRLREWEEAGADPKARPRTSFRLVSVFDRSQVAPMVDFPGEPVDLDPPGEPITGDGLSYLFPVLCEFGETIGSTIRIEDGFGDGAYSLEDGGIRVRPVSEKFSANAQVAAAVHELCHALLRSDRQDDDPELTYGEEEVVVECVSYTVCSAAGFDTSTEAVPYMAVWGKGGEIERYAALIDRFARRIEDVVLATIRPEGAESEMAIRSA
jgi:antirestriction protein ArdC